MAKLVQETRGELDKGELLALDGVRGQVLACAAGELWITLDGHREDIILGPGQRWQVPHDAPLVVSALKSSAFTVIHPRRRMPMFATGACAETLLARLLRWRHAPLAAYPATLLR